MAVAGLFEERRSKGRVENGWGLRVGGGLGMVGGDPDGCLLAAWLLTGEKGSGVLGSAIRLI